MGASHPVDSLTVVLRKLNASGHRYMLTGSVAALFYGRERTTVDVDVVIDCRGMVPERFAAALAPEFFLDVEMVRESLVTKLMFNAIPMAGGPKLDLIPLTNHPFDQVAFARRVVRDWFGTALPIVSAADLAIHTLRAVEHSPACQGFADVRAILANDVIDDVPEFERWVRRLGLQRGLDASRTSRYEA